MEIETYHGPERRHNDPMLKAISDRLDSLEKKIDLVNDKFQQVLYGTDNPSGSLTDRMSILETTMSPIYQANLNNRLSVIESKLRWLCAGLTAIGTGVLGIIIKSFLGG